MNSSKRYSERTQQYIYRIDYIRGDRTLHDSARSLEGARERIEKRLSKPRNRKEIGRIFLHGKLLREIHRNKDGGWTTAIDIRDV